MLATNSPLALRVRDATIGEKKTALGDQGNPEQVWETKTASARWNGQSICPLGHFEFASTFQEKTPVEVRRALDGI